MYSAYIDRFTEHDQAVILIDSLQQQFHVPKSALPTNCTEGTWLSVEVQNQEITTILLDHENTNAMQNTIQNRMQRLKSKKKSRFKRN